MINIGAVVATGTARGNGIVLNVTTAFVDNSGTITGKGGVGAGAALGIALNYGGVLKNELNGLIQGYAAGVSTDHTPATVTNYGTISGVATGVRLQKAAGTVNNCGFIQATGTGLADGIYLQTGGAVVNQPNGKVTGFRAGVDIHGATGSVVNYGYIATTGVGTIKNEGIWLAAGGAVVNQPSGRISGKEASSGVYITGATGTVTNSGRISAYVVGVNLASGGSVTNNANGYIGGIRISGSAGTVVNFGTIVYDNVSIPRGIRLDFGGMVVNHATGSIQGGVYAAGSPGIVENYGTIASRNASGVYLFAGGTINNATSLSVISSTPSSSFRAGIVLSGRTSAPIINFGTISGNYGVRVGTSGTAANTIRNIGTIIGNGGPAVQFGGGDDRLIEFPEAVITGTVSAGGGNNTLELWSTKQTGTLTGLGTSFTGFGTVEVDGSGNWVFVGTNPTITDTIKIDTQAMAEFQGTVGSGHTLLFTSASGTVKLDNAGQFAGTIAGFAGAQDIVDLADLNFAGTTLTSFDPLTDVLTVTEGTASVALHLDNEAYTGVTWVAKTDGQVGTDIAIACFCRGTRILTAEGEVVVEDLVIGDKVMTLSGEARPIRWIGRRSYQGRFIRGNHAVLPIRVEVGAIAEGVPARDLWLSPEHALYIDGALVPARLLVNGATITRTAKVERIDYFHIELDAHDIMLAEGMPAETYVDCDNRFMFQNAGEFAALYPEDKRPAWDFCAPRLEWGADELTAIRVSLLARAEVLGHVLDIDPDLHLIVDGEIIRPASVAGRVHRFDLPAGSAALLLASRSTVPAEAEACSRDIRRLGVAVERIALHDAEMSIEVWHGHTALREGFHEDEGAHRWTNGLARLPQTWLGPFPGAFALEVHLAASELAYRIDPLARTRAAA